MLMGNCQNEVIMFNIKNVRVIMFNIKKNPTLLKYK